MHTGQIIMLTKMLTVNQIFVSMIFKVGVRWIPGVGFRLIPLVCTRILNKIANTQPKLLFVSSRLFWLRFRYLRNFHFRSRSQSSNDLRRGRTVR